MTEVPNDTQSSAAPPFVEAARLVKFEAIAVASLGICLALVAWHLVFVPLYVVAIDVVVFGCVAYVLAWGRRRLRDGRRSGAVLVLAVTLLITVCGLVAWFLLIAAVPGCIASYKIVRNWQQLSRSAT
jgi:hypothetical protein